MTDLDTLLSQASHSPTAPAPDAVVDADLARGRRALTHRRARRTGTRSVLAGALAIGAFAAFSPGGHTAGATSASPSVSTPAGGGTLTTAATTLATGKAVTPVAVPGIKLVAYTGRQPQGYTVDSVPSGWEIQGVNNVALVIAPVDFADQQVDSFEGKLVVMLESVDQTDIPAGNPVSVGGLKGVVSHTEDNLGPSLWFTDAAGHKLDIQVPAALHWTDVQIAAFGASVHVNASAEAGRG
jgi:hypothetical protein